MNNQKFIKKLQKFGLSEGQAKTYFLLLSNSALRIQEISDLTNIPRSSVYEVVKSLQKKGLSEEIVENSHKKIRAYPLKNLKNIYKEEIFRLSNLSQRLDLLEKKLNKNKTVTSNPTTIRYYKGISGARQLLWNTLSTDGTVLVYSSWGRGKYVGINFYKEFVEESKRRLLKEQVLINPRQSTLESIKEHSETPVSRTRIDDIRALKEGKIKIKGETFIYNNIYAQLYLKDEIIGGFEIENDNFSETQRSIFRTLWDSATPLSSIL